MATDNDQGNAPDPNEQITITRAELEAALERRQREATMTPEQKEVRSMIREEVKGAFDELFQIDDDEAGESQRKQSPKGAGKSGGTKSLWDQFTGAK
jgi:hypothetical protein